MVFNDETNLQGICQEVDDLCSTTVEDYPLRTKARRATASLYTLIGKIIAVDGTWQFDDTNFTDLPVGTGTLVSGQTSYSFAGEYLDILWVKVQDQNGNWYTLKPWDQSENSRSYEDMLSHDGRPEYYDKVSDDTIRILGSVTATYLTLTGGLKVGFQRVGVPFLGDGTSGDNSQQPGIPSPWHITIAKMVALPYCQTHLPDRVPLLVKDIDAETKDLLAYFGRREKDKPRRITTKRVNPR